MQGCGSQFFPTNTERDLLMVAEQVLPRRKEPRDRKGTEHFSSPQILPGSCRFNIGLSGGRAPEGTVTWNLAHDS